MVNTVVNATETALLTKVDVWFVKIVVGLNANKSDIVNYLSKISTSLSFCNEFSLLMKESVTS